MERQLIIMALGMISTVRKTVRINWTIPATWIVSLTLALFVNVGVLIWKTSEIVTTLDRVITAQGQFTTSIEQMRDRQIDTAQALSVHVNMSRAEHERLEDMAKRLASLEADGRRK